MGGGGQNWLVVEKTYATLSDANKQNTGNKKSAQLTTTNLCKYESILDRQIITAVILVGNNAILRKNYNRFLRSSEV
jgi:hypothetical protein